MNTAANLPEFEVETPACDRWIRFVTDVPAKAKTGKDWEGEWIGKSAAHFDAQLGDLVAACVSSGTRKRPADRVTLYVVDSEGDLLCVGSHTGSDWGYELRGLARDLLALAPVDRVVHLYRKTIADWQAKAATATSAVEYWERMQTEWPAMVAAARAAGEYWIGRPRTDDLVTESISLAKLTDNGVAGILADGLASAKKEHDACLGQVMAYQSAFDDLHVLDAPLNTDGPVNVKALRAELADLDDRRAEILALLGEAGE